MTSPDSASASTTRTEILSGFIRIKTEIPARTVKIRNSEREVKIGIRSPGLICES
jgi:hypothetical protein